MPSNITFKRRYFHILFFAVATAGCGVLTIRALLRGHHAMQALLLAMLTVYTLTITLNPILQISHLKRYAAIPLGVIGTAAYGTEVPTDLPIFFILLGVASFIDLIWDPTGNVYNNKSDSS
jgi:Na+-driven multidrug efflux pump